MVFAFHLVYDGAYSQTRPDKLALKFSNYCISQLTKTFMREISFFFPEKDLLPNSKNLQGFESLRSKSVITVLVTTNHAVSQTFQDICKILCEQENSQIDPEKYIKVNHNLSVPPKVIRVHLGEEDKDNRNLPSGVHLLNTIYTLSSDYADWINISSTRITTSRQSQKSAATEVSTISMDDLETGHGLHKQQTRFDMVHLFSEIWGKPAKKVSKLLNVPLHVCSQSPLHRRLEYSLKPIREKHNFHRWSNSIGIERSTEKRLEQLGYWRKGALLQLQFAKYLDKIVKQAHGDKNELELLQEGIDLALNDKTNWRHMSMSTNDNIDRNVGVRRMVGFIAKFEAVENVDTHVLDSVQDVYSSQLADMLVNFWRIEKSNELLVLNCSPGPLNICGFIDSTDITQLEHCYQKVCSFMESEMTVELPLQSRTLTLRPAPTGENLYAQYIPVGEKIREEIRVKQAHTVPAIYPADMENPDITLLPCRMDMYHVEYISTEETTCSMNLVSRLTCAIREDIKKRNSTVLEVQLFTRQFDQMEHYWRDRRVAVPHPLHYKPDVVRFLTLLKGGQQVLMIVSRNPTLPAPVQTHHHHAGKPQKPPPTTALVIASLRSPMLGGAFGDEETMVLPSEVHTTDTFPSSYWDVDESLVWLSLPDLGCCYRWRISLRPPATTVQLPSIQKESIWAHEASPCPRRVSTNHNRLAVLSANEISVYSRSTDQPTQDKLLFRVSRESWAFGLLPDGHLIVQHSDPPQISVWSSSGQPIKRCQPTPGILDGTQQWLVPASTTAGHRGALLLNEVRLLGGDQTLTYSAEVAFSRLCSCELDRICLDEETFSKLLLTSFTLEKLYLDSEDVVLYKPKPV